jgi:single-stranded DNA-binding protein
MTSKTTITLYGNVGADPETHTIPGKEMTKKVYDPVTDDIVEREYTTPEREVRTFSIAVNYKQDGKVLTRWIRCDDWTGLSALVSTSDRVRLKGYFKVRSYEKDGEPKSVRIFVVKDLKIERSKVRSEAA